MRYIIEMYASTITAFIAVHLYTNDLELSSDVENLFSNALSHAEYWWEMS